MVKVYTKDKCQPCKATKREMGKNGVAYEEIDIETTPGASDYIKSLGFMQAPVVITDDDAWSGFIPDKIKSLATTV